MDNKQLDNHKIGEELKIKKEGIFLYFKGKIFLAKKTLTFQDENGRSEIVLDIKHPNYKEIKIDKDGVCKRCGSKCEVCSDEYE